MPATPTVGTIPLKSNIPHIPYAGTECWNGFELRLCDHFDGPIVQTDAPGPSTLQELVDTIGDRCLRGRNRERGRLIDGLDKIRSLLSAMALTMIRKQ